MDEEAEPMGNFNLKDPYDPRVSLLHSEYPETSIPASDHGNPVIPSDSEAIIDRVVESAVVRAVFGHHDMARRRFLHLVRSGTAAAILNSIFPMSAAKAMAQDKAKNIEKKDLTGGFIPITCATPIIMAEPMGFYKKHGLNATVRRASGWAMIRDWSINKEVRRGAHAEPHAARHHSRSGLPKRSVLHARRREHQRPGDHLAQ
jgi:nitrate/nitrite transport system substrate-binding protein